MTFYYISIETSVEVFELYKALWAKHGIEGVRVSTMTEGIAKAIEIERSENKQLYFVSLVADEIEFLPQLKILSEETNAPILIATSNYLEDEHHEALNCGADFYGKFCAESAKNIVAVRSVINSINRRNIKRKTPNNLIVNDDILIVSDSRKAFVNDVEIYLTDTETKFLEYLTINRGNALSYRKINDQVYDSHGSNEQTLNMIYSTMKRLRKKFKEATQRDYIETIKNVGYRLKTKNEL